MPRPERPPIPPLRSLRTLGGLHLPDDPFTRPKPLVVLAYLAHEGPTDRERLARLFFRSSRDPRDALSTTLRRLGPRVGSSPTDPRVRARVTTDALEFERLAVGGSPRAALERYRGSFLAGAASGPGVVLGVEVEEWILTCREHYGALARDLWIELGRTELAADRPRDAWHHARRAVGLTELLALEPEPSARLLEALAEAGLPVPGGWWRVLSALGLEGSAHPNAHPATRPGDGARRAARRRPHQRPDRAAGVRVGHADGRQRRRR